MDWGTILTTEIYFRREKYTNVHEVNEEIGYIDKEIRCIREKILMYCTCGISGVSTKDCEGNDVAPINALHCEIDSLFLEYEENLCKLQNLAYLKHAWNEKEGKFDGVVVY